MNLLLKLFNLQLEGISLLIKRASQIMTTLLDLSLQNVIFAFNLITCLLQCRDLEKTINLPLLRVAFAERGALSRVVTNIGKARI